MKKVSIIGFGRFGKTLFNLLKDDFKIVLYNRSAIDEKTIKYSKNITIAKELKEVYESEVIFYAIPISAFDEIISTHKKYFKDGQLLIDVLSVKMHPANVFTRILNNSKTQALLTHPMFGPDSSKNGFEGLPIIIDKFKASPENYKFWKDYFKNKKLKVVEMSAQEHDKISANSLGFTHFIGRLLEEYKFTGSPIDSLGAKKLLEIKDQTCNDTWQLFSDLQNFNPYSKEMRLKLEKAFENLYNKILPKQIDPEFITYGIQGGKGSFNEEALLYYLQRENITNYKIKYLYTTEKVMSALHKGEIDRGQFAIHSSVGGIVQESIQAVSGYNFKIIDQFALKIAPVLMMRNDAKFSDITEIMAHPQAFTLTKNTLLSKYPHLEQTSGKGELIDHSMVAKYLSEKKLPKHIATMGSKVLAQIYNLKIIEENLQDIQENYTGFLLVSRTI